MQPRKTPTRQPLFQTRAPGGQLARAQMHRKCVRVLLLPELICAIRRWTLTRALISEYKACLAVKGFYHGLVDGVDGPGDTELLLLIMKWHQRIAPASICETIGRR